MSDGFAHALRIDAIRDGKRIDLAAEEGERTAVAERLGLGRLDRLEAHATLTKIGDCVHAEGRLLASLDQACVVTGDPVAAHIDEAFEVRFIPEPKVDAPDAEIELAPEECDTVFHDGATVDLGAAIADSLALALNPYPRSAAAEAASREAGVMSEEQASPFAVLAKLKGGDDGPWKGLKT